MYTFCIKFEFFYEAVVFFYPENFVTLYDLVRE